LAKVLDTQDMSRCIGCFTCMFVCAGVNRRNHSIQKSCIKIRTYGGVSGKFVSTVCHACLEAACMEACPTGALTPRNGGGVRLSKKKCIGCRRCKSACMVKAVDFDEDAKLPLICHHCGLCAKYCPHGCLSVVEVPNSFKGEQHAL